MAKPKDGDQPKKQPQEQDLEAIRSQQKLVDRLTRELEEAEAFKKEVKARLVAAIAELHRQIRGEAPLLPFEDKGTDADAYKKIQVSDLDLSPAGKKKLLDAGLDTVGKIEARVQKEKKPLAAFVDGVGPTMAGKIDTALDKVWAARKKLMERIEKDATDAENKKPDQATDGKKTGAPPAFPAQPGSKK